MDRQLDLLLINPNSARQAYQGLADEFMAVEPPVWALLLAESCRAAGFGVEILDCNAERLNNTQATERVVEIDPRLICFVVYGSEPNAGTKNMEGAVSLAMQLKGRDPAYKICFAGSHTQALPMEVLSLPCVDFVLLNEGVNALIDLLDTNLEEEVAGIYGVGWKHPDMSPVLNPFALPVRQTDMGTGMPGMAWDLLPKKDRLLDLYRAHNWFPAYGSSERTPYAALYTSLGCPFKCQFCMINLVNRVDPSPDVTAADSTYFRYWPTQWVMKQLNHLAYNRVYTVRFSDEMFFYNPRHYLPLLEAIKGEYGDAFNFWAYARVDTVKSRHLKLFREAGVRWLCLGIESANRTIRRQVTKGSYEEVDIREVVREIENAGIEVIANYIFGLPEDNHKTMQETLNLSVELNTAMWNAYPAMALPGTPLYMEAKAKGIPLPETYSGFSFHSYDCLPLPTKYLTSAEVLRFRDEAFIKYWSRPAFHAMIEQKFGVAAVDNIKKLLQVKLKRKILGD